MKTAARTTVSIAILSSSLLMAVIAHANHTWGNFHWGRTANPLPLQLGDNVNTKWDSHLTLASNDWNVSSVLNTSVVAGKSKPQTCRATAERAEVCNSSYGATGWLGIAQIWISGDHITQGVVKLNDTYFDTTKYNTPAWRNLVTCQEVGHIFGLGHQDEDFGNAALGTCMDYTDPDPTPNQHPNQHDYELLETIYAHLDSVNTYSTGSGDGGGKGRGKPAIVGQDMDLSNPSEWGKRISDHQYERDLGNGNKVITDVFWIR